MHPSALLVSVPHPATQIKPILTTFDSAQECSLEHWLDVTRMVEREERDLDIELLLADRDCNELLVH